MKTKEFEQGQEAGRTVYQTSPNLDTNEQAEQAREQFTNAAIEGDSTGAKRTDFMTGFGSGYYLASQG